MKIGELARRSGLTASRIRFYEASGLISAQRLGNGYRDYDEQTLHRLEIITCGQQAGFSLEEMRGLMPDANPSADRHSLLLESLQRKVAEIDAMQQRLANNRAQLLAIIAGIEGKPEGMGCEENAQRVLAGLREEAGPRRRMG
ncbi:MerR family transcriptional regulator [Metapseudomonas resinovorans]|uniref:Putative MerR family transcriptional regulator n=1 Tax=Metapseudomonas resinovorans NBRC 106553 TaxID=1245471 RepID=S6BKA5_METRE|nr:MerR family transcriptional regulator [Pseudomonas resinovorans]BAN49644.1 putative MerR family transcriptional regulator [Pseudomonas resinovorans NBRC 106553]